MKPEKICLIVATHKKADFPSDSLYLPLHVGAAVSGEDLGITRDDTGENISAQNPYFCELTGLYWAWKNLDADVLGLTHYRRYFRLKGTEHPLTREELLPLLEQYHVILPNKRRYYIETLYSHYAHTHYEEHLSRTRELLASQCPDYVDSFDRVLKKRSGHMFNMMILTRPLMDDYCGWMFPLLFSLQEDMGGREQELSEFQRRVYGRIGELLFNVWLDHKLQGGELKKDEVLELPVLFTEHVNWWRKGGAFLAAKFFHKKYDRSF